ncbi:hypothetical protein [Mesorhizobium sp. BH1-1-4]|uniref:hypothetical protein n=1 Tax=Mesorhizobium sp. BH1-1-4 TaxID=2876662 RepID=UPI001CD1423D|nr:hypothetical protein [Mesorhizobium sp. BH1-1-4]MBZ9994047.1 hypothetical protein [Mesorhizobium sp. BH1-1-4]
MLVYRNIVIWFYLFRFLIIIDGLELTDVDDHPHLHRTELVSVKSIWQRIGTSRFAATALTVIGISNPTFRCYARFSIRFCPFFEPDAWSELGHERQHHWRRST